MFEVSVTLDGSWIEHRTRREQLLPRKQSVKVGSCGMGLFHPHALKSIQLNRGGATLDIDFTIL